jgi:8-oxo-dGTP diphosphatase
MYPHRIAAGAIVLKNDSMLLVRYGTTGGGSYLVGPGGGLDAGENAIQAIIRETLEETGVMVRPRRVLWIEDLQSARFKTCKIWMLCDFVSGEIIPTDGARVEGIIEVGWYGKGQLEEEIVYPPPVMLHDWDEFRSDHWETQCLPSRAASF